MRTDDREHTEETSPIGGLAAFLVLLLVAGGVLYVGALIASRTDGFRSYFRDRLEDALGLPIRIERAYLSLRLEVVLEGISESEGLVAGRPGLQMERLVLGVAPWRAGKSFGSAVYAVEAVRPFVAIAQNEAGAWQPARLVPVVRRVAAWLGADLPAPASEATNDAIARTLFARPLTVREARVIWYSPSDVMLQIAGMNWQNRILRVGDRRIMYRGLSVASVQHGEALRLNNARVAFLQTDEKTIVLDYILSLKTSGREFTGGEPVRSAQRSDFLEFLPADERVVLKSALSDALSSASTTHVGAGPNR